MRYPCRRVSRIRLKYQLPYVAQPLLLFTLAAATGGAGAQELQVPADVRTTDMNHVEVRSLKTSFDIDVLAIGHGSHALSYKIYSDPNSMRDWRDNFEIHRSTRGSTTPGTPRLEATLVLGPHRSTFYKDAAGIWQPARNNGSDIGGSLWTLRDGTRVYMRDSLNGNPNGYPDLIVYPDGRRISFNRDADGRFRSITQNNGLMLRPTADGVTAINLAHEYCDPRGVCDLTKNWPSATFVERDVDGDKEVSITLPGGASHRFLHEYRSRWLSYNIVKYKPPGSIDYQLIYEIGDQYSCTATDCDLIERDLVASARSTVAGLWEYGRSISRSPDPSALTTSTGPIGPDERQHTVSFYFDVRPRVEDSMTVTQRSTQTVRFDDSNLPRSSTGPARQYVHDDRGNLTEIRTLGGEGLPDLVETARYPEGCSASDFLCNKPLWVRDANQNQTDFQHYPEHGMIKSIHGPADEFGVRPRTYYTYRVDRAWTKNEEGGYTQSAGGIWLPYQEISCRNGNQTVLGACDEGDADKVTKTYFYQVGEGPNNLFPRGHQISAYDEASARVVRQVTCYTYDMYGNKISETTPRGYGGSCP